MLTALSSALGQLFLGRLGPVISAAAVLLILSLSAALGWSRFEVLGARHDLDQVRRDTATRDAQANALAAAVAIRERGRDEEHAREIESVRQKYSQEIDHAKDRITELDRQLHAGSVRVRPSICREAGTNGMPDPAASAGGTDGGHQLRATGAGRIIGTVARCKAQVEGLKQYVHLQVKRCNAPTPNP